MKKKRSKRRVTRKPEPAGLAVGFAWYRPEDWEAWKAACPDFEDTHADWERQALKSLQQIQRNGLSVKKVFPELDAFLLWCAEHDEKRSSDSRSRYVAELLQRRSTEAE